MLIESFCSGNIDDILRDISLKKQHTIASFDPAIVNLGVRIEVRRSELDRTTLYYARWHLNSKDTFTDLITRIRSIIDLLKSCDFIVCERQMPINYDMVRLSQHLMSSIRLLLPDVIILEVSIALKARYLKDLYGKDIDVKKEAIRRAKDLLDQQGLDILKSESKKDDLSDTLVQIEGVFFWIRTEFKAPKPVIRRLNLQKS